MKNNEIEKIRRALEYRIEEWVGFDTPNAGSEDYDQWLGMIQEVNDIVSIADVMSYLESNNIDTDDFFIDGEFDLIAAGLSPDEVPAAILSKLGSEIDSKKGMDDSLVRVLEYGGQYFLMDRGQVLHFSSEIDAINYLGVSQTPEDNINLACEAYSDRLSLDEAKERLSEVQERPVLIVVKNWPDGTMAFKLGSAIQSALDISKDQMSVVQISPERIFRVLTCVDERDFRSALKDRVGSISDGVLFIEI
jgi:hypothetical protein